MDSRKLKNTDNVCCIGLTGGTGTGKTTVLQALEKEGMLALDCDAIYHELLETSRAMLAELKERFPSAFSNGVLDRKALGRLVFQNESELLALNAISHRYVIDEVRRRLRDWGRQGGQYAVIDAIALIESGLAKLCSLTVGVTAPRELRLQRIMAREGIGEEYAGRRIDAQHEDAWFRDHCDMVIDNGGTLEYLNEQIQFIINRIRSLPMADEKKDELRESLFYTQKHGYDTLDLDERLKLEAYCEDYKAFLNDARTEREAVAEAIRQAEAAGFIPYSPDMELTPGTKVYKSNRGKSLLLAVIGKKSLAEGANIAAAHVDSPRLDLKQLPLYETHELAYFKTHYYGGLKKYQWLTIPLELHGVVTKLDGETVDVVIGREPDDPKLVITDLLPHLAKDQMNKPASEFIKGENLNLLVGSIPYADEGKDRVKLAILSLLKDRYDITEEDFVSAELEAVPAFDVCDLGLDRSLIGGYGHDDRVCAYAELRAVFETELPEHTAVCILSDKEEIGSVGSTGMQSRAFECFMEDLCASQGVALRHCLENSFCVSADVCNAYDPIFWETTELPNRNGAKLNYGIGICKYTGARGKRSCNDASAEAVGTLRRIFSDNGVCWQMAELGKVDQGGGGTVAAFMGNRNINTIDAGVPVLSMHAPFETVAKFDCYMTYKGIRSVFKDR